MGVGEESIDVAEGVGAGDPSTENSGVGLPTLRTVGGEPQPARTNARTTADTAAPMSFTQALTAA